MNESRFFCLLLVCAGGSILAPPSWSDSLVLTNGDTLSGTVVGMEDGKLLIETEYAGTIAIDPDFVRALDSDAEIMWIDGAGEAKSGLLHIEDGESTLVRDAEATPVDLPAATYLGALLPEEARNEVAWSGTLDAQLAWRSGETDTLDADTGVTANRRKLRRLLNSTTRVSDLTLSLSGAYGEVDGELDTQRGAAEEEYRYYVKPRVYVLEFLAFEHDEGRGLDYRATGGLGAGYDVLVSDARELSVDGALAYDHEVWDENGGTRREDEMRLRLGLDYLERFHGGSSLTDSLHVNPSLTETGEYRLVNRLAFTAPLSARMYFRAEWRVEYDSDPGSDVDELDNYLTTGVRYEF